MGINEVPQRPAILHVETLIWLPRNTVLRSKYEFEARDESLF